MNGEGSTGQNARECLADQRNLGLCESAHTTFFVSYLQRSLIYLLRPLFWESLSIPYIPLILGQNIPYPNNSRGSYPYNASYHDDVIERDMFRYPTTKIHFPGAFHISNRNYTQIRHHANQWYALM